MPSGTSSHSVPPSGDRDDLDHIDACSSSALVQFAKDLSQQTTYESVLACAATWIPRVFPGGHTSMTLAVSLKGSWSIGSPTELEVTAFEGSDAFHSGQRFPVADSRAGHAFTTGEIAGSDELEGETHADLIALRASGLRSSRSAPLIACGEIIGTLNAARTELSAFSCADEQRLLEASNILAAQCLLHRRVAEAKVATEREAENSRIVTLLHRLQSKLARLSDEGEVCSATAHYVRRIFRCDQASLALLDPGGETVTVRALTRERSKESSDVTVVVAGSAFEQSILQKRTVAWKSDEDLEFEGVPDHALVGLRSGISAPLSSGVEVLGTLNLASVKKSAFSKENATRIAELAGIIGTALANLRAHNALRSAQEDAEAASVAKGAFLANVSHELRTPLNGVLGMAQLLEGTSLDDEQLELVTTITSSGELLMRVISDVLEVSKIESGSAVLEALPFDPGRTVEKACSMVSPAAHAKGIELAYDNSPGLPRQVIGDPTRLQQIVVNLLSNAVKFTSEGGVYVTMAAREHGDGEHLIEIAVRDTGKGIAQESLERIFVPFQQEEASTTRRFGGTGLGLGICRQFAELMGGDVSATSTEGEGSVFTVSIVLGGVEADSKAKSEPDSGSALDGTFADSHPLDILVVDDNPVNRRVAQRLLQRLGYGPQLAVSGREAIDLTAASPFDLVLMDLSMPDIDGLEATETIFKTLTNPPTIVALTADVQASTREHCLSIGMFGLIAKPFRVSDLKDQLLAVSAHQGSDLKAA